MSNIKKQSFEKLKEIFQKIRFDDNSNYTDIERSFFYEDVNEKEINEFLDNEESKFIEGMEVIDTYGGEGMGENYWVVWYFPTVDIYVKFYGWYQSYEGSEYEDMELVEPREVVVTKYFEIN